MTTFSLCVSAALIWILFFWFYRDYRVDRFRQNLFALRDELFDMAQSGKLEFNDPAYGMLRSMINGTIQFGHRLGLLDLLMLGVAVRGSPNPEPFIDRWNSQCVKLPTETAQELQAIRERLHFFMFEQLILTSSLLFFTIVIVAIWALAGELKTALFNRLRRALDGRRLSQFLARLDAAACLRAST